jgi:hypothetical protein
MRSIAPLCVHGSEERLNVETVRVNGAHEPG